MNDDTDDWGENVERPTVPMPRFTLDTVTNTAAIEWPDGRPDAVSMTSDDLERWVDDRNEDVARITNIEESIRLASDRIAELTAENETFRRRNETLGAQVAALRTVTEILRLGRRPNREQWMATGMLAGHAQLESDRVD